MGGKLESRFRVFGQACHLVIKPEAIAPEDILHIAQQEFRRIEHRFDSFDQTSVIGNINGRAGSGEVTALDAESRSLFQYAQVLWEQSHHLYDPTAYNLQRLYSDGRATGRSNSVLRSELARTGWMKFEVSNEGALLQEADMFLNLNSCVRPYAVDCVKRLLIKSGITNALIDLDRDVATIGKQPDGANWLIGTRYPSGSRTAIERFKLNNKAYALRGDFEKCLTIEGERFGRALSPVDGLPIPGLLGVAVTAESCLTACSAASIARLKTEDSALKWLSTLGLPWLAIDRDLNCHGPLARS